MEKSLFAFIWKYSRRDQLRLLAVTLLTFPMLFATLELPKRIINDAIGSSTEMVSLFGYALTSTQFLMTLCAGFLISVLLHGVVKMRLNTMKGVLAERMLRRFRYVLLNRMHRFPKSYFRKTSQGELVSMVTSEAEPMGGLMGDALSQPVFQAGQMLTILVFLFAQSVWFGLASIALIPLQAWLIPRLQRQINLLNKSRIQEVRRLASDIGESAAGVSDLRLNGGLRYRMALFSDRLGRLYAIRFQIYQKKYFMKFINNFINQLTPFFFYSVGGYLAIRGDISVGALVAALAAYKDLSSPWKELLTYYNQVQDMSLRWAVVTDRFAPAEQIDETLYEGVPANVPRLQGDIVLSDVTVTDENGNSVLERINLTIPYGAKVAIKVSDSSAGLAFADLLTRELVPSRGSVTVAGHALNDLHQTVIAGRIGYAHSQPHLFEGTLGENLLMPFMHLPQNGGDLTATQHQNQIESQRAGNSSDVFSGDWIDPTVAGFDTSEEIRKWWFQLIEAMGIDDFMVRRTLQSVLNIQKHAALAQAIVDARPEVARRLTEAGLDDVVFRHDPEQFNPVSPLGSNLLYALPTRPLQQRSLAEEVNFVRLMHQEKLAVEVTDIGMNVIDGLNAAFGTDGTDHPLFRMLNLDEDLYLQLTDLARKRREHGEASLSELECGLLMTVPFAFSAEQIGPSFTDEFKARVLQIRRESSERLILEMGDGLFERLDENTYTPIMSVLGNAIFGRISRMAGAREEQVIEIVMEVLTEQGLRLKLAECIYDVETGIGGANLPAVFRERASFSRAGIKRPDILILHDALASHSAEARSRTRQRLGSLLPEATKIYIESHFNAPETYDMFIEIKDGRIDGLDPALAEGEDSLSRSDLNKKLKKIGETELFAKLPRKQQRLLAYSSQWYSAAKGQRIFSEGDAADAAYLCISGSAGLFFADRVFRPEPITEVGPGRLIGDLSVILGDVRNTDLDALEDSVFLRIGARELLAVIESDVAVATSLLQTVSGHLVGAVTNFQEAMAQKQADDQSKS